MNFTDGFGQILTLFSAKKLFLGHSSHSRSYGYIMPSIFYKKLTKTNHLVPNLTLWFNLVWKYGPKIWPCGAMNTDFFFFFWIEDKNERAHTPKMTCGFFSFNDLCNNIIKIQKYGSMCFFLRICIFVENHNKIYAIFCPECHLKIWV